MNSKAAVWAVIAAAGSGSRMRSEIPKQYLSIQGKSLLEHCLDRLLSHAAIEGAVVVLGNADERWRKMEYQSRKPLITALGGAERSDSVYSGLTALRQKCGDDVIALVHDAARPLVSHDDLDRVIEAARPQRAGAILACPLADTLKRQDVHGQIETTLPREGLWRALTPQVFHLVPLMDALQRVIDGEIAVTDDAQALELAGYHPVLVEGRADNIKITTPADLRLAQTIWLNQRDQHDDE